jgi:hypothetical protein
MTNADQKLVMRGVAAGAMVGLTLGLMIALFIALRPELFAGLLH